MCLRKLYVSICIRLDMYDRLLRRFYFPKGITSFPNLIPYRHQENFAFLIHFLLFLENCSLVCFSADSVFRLLVRLDTQQYPFVLSELTVQLTYLLNYPFVLLDCRICRYLYWSIYVGIPFYQKKT